MAMLLRTLCLVFTVAPAQGARLLRQTFSPSEEPVEQEMDELLGFFGNSKANKTNKDSHAVKDDAAPTPKENPKCDRACTNGSLDRRAKCMVQCEKMQKKICDEKFSCYKGCANDNPYMKQDDKCESLCNDVYEKICSPMWEAPEEALSPHHDDKIPPSVEATPAPRIYTGSFMFCNLYAASYSFDVLRLKDVEAKDGESMAKLGYKECQEIEMASFEHVGLKVDGKIAAVSKPIDKTPSIMLFGQFALGNHQIEFNRYFAKGEGPIICNGMPIWEKTDSGEKVMLYRNEKSLAELRYKECMPTGLKNGDVLKAEVKGTKVAQYKVSESPRVIVFGKAGETGAVAFEAWIKGPTTGF
jgi:hypothetical protein